MCQDNWGELGEIMEKEDSLGKNHITASLNQRTPL